MNSIGYVLLTILILLVGIGFGGLLAKCRFKKYIKLLEKGAKEAITSEQMKKTMEINEKFWKMKKEVDDERRDKYKQNGTGENYSNAAARDRAERREDIRVKDNSSSIERESMENTPIEQLESDSKGIELHVPNQL